jgi:hypothetical protein
MQALSYEYVIRMAFNVGRGLANGADAHIYRKWEHEIRGLELQREAILKRQPIIDTRSIEELEYQARVAGTKVRENLRRAILRVKSQKLSNTYDEELDNLQYKLSLKTFDRATIDCVIDDILELFKKMKLSAE